MTHTAQQLFGIVAIVVCLAGLAGIILTLVINELLTFVPSPRVKEHTSVNGTRSGRHVGPNGTFYGAVSMPDRVALVALGVPERTLYEPEMAQKIWELHREHEAPTVCYGDSDLDQTARVWNPKN